MLAITRRRLSACQREPARGIRWLRPSRAILFVLAELAIALAAYAWMVLHDPTGHFRLLPDERTPVAENFVLDGSDGYRHAMWDYRGRIVVLFFGFTHCPEACPLELYKLSQVMRRLGRERSRIQVLMVTLDPQRDSAALLRSYVTAFDPGFIGLTGTQSEVNVAAAGYGVRSRRIQLEGDYTLEHSAAVYVIDGRGRRRLTGGPNTSVEDLVHDLKQLIDE